MEQADLKLVWNSKNLSFTILFFIDLNLDGIDTGTLNGCVSSIEERLMSL